MSNTIASSNIRHTQHLAGVCYIMSLLKGLNLTRTLTSPWNITAPSPPIKPWLRVHRTVFPSSSFVRHAWGSGGRGRETVLTPEV
nr:C5 protein [Tomato yellow leaf curl Kanchanaburi virus]QIH55873.1 C5 protein [Tomato yellow leaf curl Kanchanaburi virus]